MLSQPGLFPASVVSTARLIFIWCYVSAHLWSTALWQTTTHILLKVVIHFPIKINFANSSGMTRLWYSFFPPLGLTTFKYVNPLTPHLLFFGPGTLTLIFTDFHTRAILLLLWFWQIVKMAAVLPFTVIMPLACDFEAFPIKKWSLFSHPSNLGWLCDLLWLTECGESDSVPALSLDFKRSIHFYICLFSWTPT